MRLLFLTVLLSALGTASFWALTSGPLAPPSHRVVSIDSLRVTSTGGEVVESPPERSVPERLREPAREPIEVRVTNHTYAVTGKTADDVLRSLVEKGPREEGNVFFGLTEAGFNARYNRHAISGGCIIENTEVDLEVAVTLPEWMPEPGTDPALLRDWGQFRRRLAAHEERHKEIALDWAEEAYRAVAGLYRPTCEQAEAEVRARLERLGVESIAAQRRYDVETSHGRTEGVRWPIR